MKDPIPSELSNKKTRAESASAERTVEYSTDEGTVKERTTVAYKVDNGNVIDNAVNVVTESKSVRKAASFINKLIRLAVTGVGGLFAGALSYEVGEDMYRGSFDRGTYTYAWEVPEPVVIIGSVVIGMVSALLIFSVYKKLLMKNN
ncbi:MAG: hypothetical protein V7739_20215 [Motiliproteus sp.]